MKPIVLAALVLAAGAGAAAAQVSPGPEPTASERAFIAACLAKHTDSASARKACVGVDLGACLGLEDAPKTIKTNGFGHPRDCAAIERQIWDGWLNRWYGEALKKIPAAAVDKLKAAQRAWIAWRDAGCAVDFGAARLAARRRQRRDLPDGGDRQPRPRPARHGGGRLRGGQ